MDGNLKENNFVKYMETKKFWHSKTLWVNLIAIVGIVLNSLYGVEIDAELQATFATAILGVINIILRLITKQPIA